MHYLLDTNICIYIVNDRPAAVRARFASATAGAVGMSTITSGELIWGAQVSLKPRENLQRLRAFARLEPVLDLPAEYYLQTCDTVFIRHALPKGEMTHRGIPIDPSKIRRVALMTVEGENDDISGVGQTEAAHTLCVNIPQDRKYHWLQSDVGHYGVFNGSRFRAEIAPRIADFVLSNNANGTQKKGVANPRSTNGASHGTNGVAPNGSAKPPPRPTA